MTSSHPDQKLLKACKNGDSHSQKELYDFFAPRMMVVATRYTKSVEEAEDILQDSFVKIFSKIKSLKDPEKIGGWIKKIVVNTALNHNRSKLYMFPMTEINETTSVYNEELNLSYFHFEELLTMIRSLPSGCQVIFNLYAIEGFNHHEIGKKLSISVGTSKSQYARARKLLIEMLEKNQKVNYGAI